MTFIDPRVKFVGVSSLRELNVGKLRDFAESESLVVIQHDCEPVSVLMPYALFQSMQADLVRYEAFLKESK